VAPRAEVDQALPVGVQRANSLQILAEVATGNLEAMDSQMPEDSVYVSVMDTMASLPQEDLDVAGVFTDAEGEETRSANPEEI